MAGSKKSVLIVEDEKPMAKALQLKLGNQGFDAHVAFNGEEAIEKITGGAFDLVLLDLMMPKMDGFEVLKELKKRGIKVPVIVSSNLSQAEDKEKVKELGAVGFFVKSNTPLSGVIDNVKKHLT